MELITKLKNIVGKENASNDASALRFFAEDYSFCPFSMPDYVVKPKDSKEIQAVVKLANEKNIPVIPALLLFNHQDVNGQSNNQSGQQ